MGEPSVSNKGFLIYSPYPLEMQKKSKKSRHFKGAKGIMRISRGHAFFLEKNCFFLDIFMFFRFFEQFYTKYELWFAEFLVSKT